MNTKIRGILSVLMIACLLLLICLSKAYLLPVIHYFLDDINCFVERHYFLSVSVFIIIFCGMTICMIPATVLLSLLSGYLYGIFWGTCYAITGATMGTVLSVVLLRRYGSVFLGTNVDIKEGSPLKQQFDDRGIWFVIAANIIPITPTPLIIILVSMSSLPLIFFAGATAIGLLPCTLIYTTAGLQIHKLHSLDDIIPGPLLSGMFVVAIVIIIPAWFYKKRD